jgi:hypothetical protein
MKKPGPLRVRVPVMPSEDVDLYTPDVRVRPPRSPDTVAVAGCLSALKYAVVRSVWAWPAEPSASCNAPPPVTAPGGNPVTAVPGLTPRFPKMTVGPVFVTVEPANTV